MELHSREILRSKEEKRILTGNIVGIELEYYRPKKKDIPCSILWKNDIKILIPISHLVKNKENKSIIRGMLGSEIDYIILEYDEISNIAIASRLQAMELRQKLELPKLKKDDIIKVRIIAVGVKHIVVDMYGLEINIRANELKHTYIVNCKELYNVGEYLKVKIKGMDIENKIYELSSKEFEDNPFKNIRKYIILNGEYIGKVIGFCKNSSGILVQLDNSNVTVLVRVPARFNGYPHYLDKVLIKITEIKEDKKLVYGYLVRVI